MAGGNLSDKSFDALISVKETQTLNAIILFFLSSVKLCERSYKIKRNLRYNIL